MNLNLLYDAVMYIASVAVPVIKHIFFIFNYIDSSKVGDCLLKWLQFLPYCFVWYLCYILTFDQCNTIHIFFYVCLISKTLDTLSVCFGIVGTFVGPRQLHNNSIFNPRSGICKLYFIYCLVFCLTPLQ